MLTGSYDNNAQDDNLKDIGLHNSSLPGKILHNWHREQVQNALNLIYLCLAGMFFGYRTFFNTMIRKELGISRVKPVEHIWLALMLLLILFKMMYVQCYSIREIAVSLLFCSLCAVVWKKSHTYWILMFPLLLVGAKGVSFDLIVKVYLVINGSILGLAAILSLCGVTTDLQYVRWVSDVSYESGGYNIIRHSFGTTFPTTFSEFVFFWNAGFLYVRRRTLSFFDLILPVVFAGILFYFCDAITDTLCVGLLAGAGFWVIMKRRLPELLRNTFEKVGVVLVFSMPVAGILMNMMAFMFNPESPAWTSIDNALHLRLSFGHIGFEKYGVTPFGSWVRYHTTGGSTDIERVTNYFNLDCSYLLVLINFGLVFFCVIMVLFTLLGWKAWKRKDTMLLLILFITSLQCIMENRLVQPQYNVFCLMLLANLWEEPGGLRLKRNKIEDKGSREQMNPHEPICDQREPENAGQTDISALQTKRIAQNEKGREKSKNKAQQRKTTKEKNKRQQQEITTKVDNARKRER